MRYSGGRRKKGGVRHYAEETTGIGLGNAVYADPRDPMQGFYFLNPMATLAAGGGASAITVAAPDGSFRPNAPVSRAEVASVVYRMPERSADLDYIKENPDELRSFSDVAESHWAYKPVMEAANAHDYTVENDVET